MKIGQAYDGMTYAGIVRGNEGEPDYHLLVHQEEKNSCSWDNAMTWASEIGCSLPRRKEQAILFGQVPELFLPRWYWSGEQHASYADYAWSQSFDDGYQDDNDKSYEGRARAVRRFSFNGGSMTEQIKPCPHCGEVAVFDYTTDGAMFIACLNCGASTNLVYPCGDDPKTVLLEKWNKRVKE
jgi:hypothetical protein